MVQAEVARINKENNNTITYTNNGYKDVLDVVRHQTDTKQSNVAMQASPISMSSGESNNVGNDSVNNEIIANLGLGDNGDRDGDGGGSGAGGNVDYDNDHNRNNRYGGGRKHEFALVSPRNVTITTFTGRNLHTNPYMPFNNALRRLMLAQGQDGEMLLQVLDKIEKLGNNKYTNEQLTELGKVYPKATEFEIAIKTALINWTAGIANNLVRYGVCNGFDAWRKL